jgi:hypothetical protein
MKPFSEQILYFRQHPPTNLKELTLQPAIVPDIAFGGHGFSGKFPDGLIKNMDIVFKAQCPCGGSIFTIQAKSEHDEINYYQSLVIAEQYFFSCSSCGKQSLLFDPMQHGYNPEVSRLEEWSDDELELPVSKLEVPEKVCCACATCQENEMELIIRLEYHNDLIGYEAFAGREENFFSWFSVVGKCSNCSELNLFIDCECA